MPARLSALVLLLAFCAMGQQQENPPFRLPDGVEVQPNLVYGSGGGRDLRLDLYLPKTAAGAFPAVVYIHGGGWSGGNKNAFRRQAAYMATKGFAGACIEYRLSGEAKFPAALYDSKAAVRWVRANAAKYRINPDRIGAAGGSAGGHLVAMLGATAGMREFEGDGGNPNFSTRVQAVAAFNPALDLVSFGKRNPSSASNSVYQFLGSTYSERPELWAKASPPTHVSKDSAPFLLLHGTADQLVPFQQSLDLQKKLQAADVPAELFSGDGGQHGFFNRPPFFEPALQRMEEFFTKFLK